MTDRITPFDKRCTISERLDEIVATATNVHIEMLDDDMAFMQIGEDRFSIYVERGKLFIAWRESDSKERNELLSKSVDDVLTRRSKTRTEGET